MGKNNKSDSISIGTVLFLIFLTLKLAGVVNWSWWWVTSPLWILSVLALVMIVFLVIVSYISDRY
jgi:hypothetical protein